MNTDSVFLTSLIGAHDHRVVEMLYIENAFLHAKNDKYLLMLISGKLKELLVNVDPKLYRKYSITSKQGVPMLYVKLAKDICVMLLSAMLF